jgi:hypothetical protein
VPRAVYSTRFLRIGARGASSSTYVVPTGFVAVVRDVAVLLEGDATSNAELFVEAPSTWIGYWAPAATGTHTYQWIGRQVIEAGETLAGDCSGTTWASLWASGYLLSV